MKDSTRALRIANRRALASIAWTLDVAENLSTSPEKARSVAHTRPHRESHRGCLEARHARRNVERAQASRVRQIARTDASARIEFFRVAAALGVVVALVGAPLLHTENARPERRRAETSAFPSLLVRGTARTRRCVPVTTARRIVRLRTALRSAPASHGREQSDDQHRADTTRVSHPSCSFHRFCPGHGAAAEVWTMEPCRSRRSKPWAGNLSGRS